MTDIPDMPDLCWPVDTSACPDFENMDDDVQAFAEALAAQTLRLLTGYTVGGCPVLLRPCAASCVSSSPAWYGWGGTWRPTIDSLGQWLNTCGCSPSGCACTNLSAILIPGGVGAVLEVKVDGSVLDPSKYALLNGHRLVRTDGESWPTCQDMALPDSDENTFSVSIQRGVPVDGLGSRVAGILACEYAKGMTGKKCRLPSGVTNISRQGVTMELQTGLFPGGLTGIREVDVYIRRYNPYGLQRGSSVWSPDLDNTVVIR